jgi:predicted nucleic acid-binding protein
MIVVADTSPINYLVLIGHVDLLPNFYRRIVVPLSVWEELRDSCTPDAVRAWLSWPPKWVERRRPQGKPDPTLDFLDRGEREAIGLASELSADRLIVDETLAREAAVRLGLSVIGTLGVLRNGARAGRLDLPEALAALQRTSFYVGQELILSLLEEDAERRKGK